MNISTYSLLLDVPLTLQKVSGGLRNLCGWTCSCCLHGLQAAAVHMADKALAAFVIIQAALKRSPRLQQYSQRADLNERMPDFQACSPSFWKPLPSLATDALLMYKDHLTSLLNI